MDYEALAQLLPLPAHLWQASDVTQWLHFIHLPALAPSFRTPRLIQNLSASSDRLSLHSPNPNCRC
jgi:hypothetical protein